jgi:hypothetical protein
MPSPAIREMIGFVSRAYSASTAWASALTPLVAEKPGGNDKVSSTS